MPSLSVQFLPNGGTKGFLGTVGSGKVTFTFTTAIADSLKAAVQAHDPEKQISVANDTSSDGTQDATLVIEVANDLPVDYWVMCIPEKNDQDNAVITAKVDW